MRQLSLQGSKKKLAGFIALKNELHRCLTECAYAIKKDDASYRYGYM
jgi:hypothetical protein